VLRLVSIFCLIATVRVFVFTVLFLTVSQLQVNAPAFSSRANSFHRKSL
jgi:hypothetical protein